MNLERKTCIRFGITAALLYLFVHYWNFIAGALALVLHASSPLITGCIVAYAVNILMCFYEKHFMPGTKKKWILKSRGAVCLVLSYMSLLGIIALIIGLIVPELSNCVKVLLEKIPPFMEKISKEVTNNMPVVDYVKSLVSAAQGGEIDWQMLINKAAGWMSGRIGGAMGVVGNVISATFSTAFNIIMSLIFSVYLLAGKKKIGNQVKRVAKTYMKAGIYDKVEYFLITLNDSFHSFIVGQCLDAVILGSLCALGLFILRMPYAGMIGALIGFTALIPVAGAYIGGTVGCLMIATSSPMQALIFVIFLVVLQQLEGQLIYPRVVGASIGLPGIWVLAAVTIGGGVMGIGGMLLFVPLASALYKLLKNDVKQRNQ